MKLYYEVKMKVLIEADDDADIDSISGQLDERLDNLANIEDGVVSVLDIETMLYHSK